MNIIIEDVQLERAMNSDESPGDVLLDFPYSTGDSREASGPMPIRDPDP